MNPTQNQISFADCVVEFSTQRLFRNGKPVSLEPKMYQLLVVLIQRRPAIVTNEELDEILWPKVYVARTSLTRLVSELRSQLGDNPRESQIIRTVYKRGYAFCAETSRPALQVTQRSDLSLLWAGRLIPLAEGEYIVGRGDDCTLVIDAETVSRRHARITVRQGAAVIEDLSSRNGTHVNGRSIEGPTPLPPGCEISLGSAVLTMRKRNASAVTQTSSLRISHSD